MKLQVTACDIDQKIPAKTYTITADDGRSISKDLCKEHAEPFEEWLEEAEVGEEAADDLKKLRADWLGTGEGSLGEEEAEPASEPEPAPVVPKRTQPRRVATKKVAAKKATPSRRRPKITSLEEIEASKKR